MQFSEKNGQIVPPPPLRDLRPFLGNPRFLDLPLTASFSPRYQWLLKEGCTILVGVAEEGAAATGSRRAAQESTSEGERGER